MKTRNLALDIIIVIIFLSIALVSLDLFRRDLMRTFRLQNEDPVGTVVVKRNIVQRRLGDRVLWDRLAKESPVYFWDLIRVAELSDATLYINNSSISLHENTLIRIIPSPDGEGIMVVLSQGSLLLAANEGSEGLILDINGQHIRPAPGTFITTSVSENGEVSYRIIESADEIIQEGAAREIRSSQLISPVVNSVIRYSNNPPSVNFQWTETENAAYYIIEISASPDFTNPKIRKQTSSVFLADSTLENGLWYWRVMPVIPSIFNGLSEFSAPLFFRIERAGIIEDEVSLSDWLVMTAPSTEVPYEVPVQFVPENFTVMEAPPQTQINTIAAISETSSPTVPQPAAPPELLPAAQNLRPADRTIFGYIELQSQRSINFSWAQVQGANAYIFTLYRQASDGMHEVITTTVTSANYSLSDLQVLDNGTFLWKVEPVRTARGSVINRRGNTAESFFTIDFPAPLPVQIEETGILYGN